MAIGHLVPNYATVMTLKKPQFVNFVAEQSFNSHNESISLPKRNLTSLSIDDQYYAQHHRLGSGFSNQLVFTKCQDTTSIKVF